MNRERARQEMKKVDYLLRDSQMSGETWQLVAVLSESCFELSELITVYTYHDILDRYFRGHINVYDVFIEIMEKTQEEKK